jgi:DNA-binding transcriptional LysR family regulator
MSEGLPGPDLTDLHCFLKVAEVGSFSAAALALGLPKATLSRRVAALERRLGTQLLARTTRTVRCTAAGADYARRARPALAALLEAEAGLGPTPSGLRGPLRIHAPRAYGETVLAPLVASFQRQHPALGLELLIGAEGGVAIPDLRVVPGGPAAADRVAIDRIQAGLYASPEFISGLGRLDYAHELDGVAGLSADDAQVWSLTDGSGTLRLQVRPVLRTDSARMVRAAAEAGLGVALLPTFLAADAVARGRVRRLFPAWRTPEETVYATWSGSEPSSAARALIDHLCAARGAAMEDIT